MYETAKETLMYRTVLWTLWERERVGRNDGLNMYTLYVNASNVDPQDISRRSNGYSVRCMIKAS